MWGMGKGAWREELGWLGENAKGDGGLDESGRGWRRVTGGMGSTGGTTN